MKPRPRGITIMAVMTGVAVPWMTLLAALSLADPKALEGLLRGLSPGGSGPAAVHLGMGRLLPVYYLSVAAISAALAIGLWRLRRWARLVILAVVGISFLGLLASTTSLVRGASAGAWALFALRLGLCLATGGYLVSSRVREAFRGPTPARRGWAEALSLRVVDRALPWGGLALTALGLAAWPTVLPVGLAALALAFFAWVAEWNGIGLPRPGRARVRTVTCWESPLAFTVRHRGRSLLFSRDDDPASGAWSDLYTVHERQDGQDLDPRWELPPFTKESSWAVRGRVPVDSLLFEHHERVSYVQRGSLDRALAARAA